HCCAYSPNSPVFGLYIQLISVAFFVINCSTDCDQACLGVDLEEDLTISALIGIQGAPSPREPCRRLLRGRKWGSERRRRRRRRRISGGAAAAAAAAATLRRGASSPSAVSLSP
uniref:Uncharacterized protein n=1 Tax=Salvator merianae TaxID=96440 RepID=A0A8D0C344_SALMN